MPQIIWSNNALDDIERLHRFLKSKSESAAIRAVTLILEAGQQLQKFPTIGKPVTKRPNHRDLIKSFGAGAYVIRYRIEPENSVVILKIWHSKENH